MIVTSRDTRYGAGVQLVVDAEVYVYGRMRRLPDCQLAVLAWLIVMSTSSTRDAAATLDNVLRERDKEEKVASFPSDSINSSQDLLAAFAGVSVSSSQSVEGMTIADGLSKVVFLRVFSARRPCRQRAHGTRRRLRRERDVRGVPAAGFDAGSLNFVMKQCRIASPTYSSTW